MVGIKLIETRALMHMRSLQATKRGMTTSFFTALSIHTVTLRTVSLSAPLNAESVALNVIAEVQRDNVATRRDLSSLATEFADIKAEFSRRELKRKRVPTGLKFL